MQIWILQQELCLIFSHLKSVQSIKRLIIQFYHQFQRSLFVQKTSEGSALSVWARLHEPAERGLRNELRLFRHPVSPALSPAGERPARPETQGGSQPCCSWGPCLLPVGLVTGTEALLLLVCVCVYMLLLIRLMKTRLLALMRPALQSGGHMSLLWNHQIPLFCLKWRFDIISVRKIFTLLFPVLFLCHFLLPSLSKSFFLNSGVTIPKQ